MPEITCAYCNQQLEDTDGVKWQWPHHRMCWIARLRDMWAQAPADQRKRIESLASRLQSPDD